MQGNNFKETVITATTTWAPTAIELNPDRTNLIVYNTGASDLKVGISEAGSFTVPAGDALAFGSDTPINAIGMKSLSGSTTAVIWEA